MLEAAMADRIRVNITLDPKTVEDAKRLATEQRTTVSALIERLVLYEAAGESVRGIVRAELQPHQVDVLQAVSNLQNVGTAATRDKIASVVGDAGLVSDLNHLRLFGYLRRFKSGYVLTKKGDAATM